MQWQSYVIEQHNLDGSVNLCILILFHRRRITRFGWISLWTVLNPPLSFLFFKLSSSISLQGAETAYQVRFAIGKFGLIIAGGYGLAYYLKYNSNVGINFDVSNSPISPELTGCLVSGLEPQRWIESLPQSDSLLSRRSRLPSTIRPLKTTRICQSQFRQQSNLIFIQICSFSKHFRE